MRSLFYLFALAGLVATGCDAVVPPGKNTAPTATSLPTSRPKAFPTSREPTTNPTTTGTQPVAVNPDPMTPINPMDPEPEGKAETLPDVPKSDPKSTIKPLNKENTLLLETRPDGRKRVLVVAEVVLRRGMLEVFLCKKNTKEHESVLRTSVDARFIHAALIVAGGRVGAPVQFINQKTQELEYKPASGGMIRVGVAYKLEGKVQEHPAQEWITEQKTKKPMTHQWVFAGSRFLKNPDMSDQPDYYTANNGEVISLANFVDSMLELPVQISRETPEEFFHAATKRIPPLQSQVWVILEAVPEKS